MVSHLKGYCSGDPPKDGNNNAAMPSADSSEKTNSKRKASVKQENGQEWPTGQHSNNLHNLHNSIAHDLSAKGHSSVLPPSPSALSSSSSSSATTSSNSLESGDQLYGIPYALLKSKKFKIDHSSNLNSYKPSQTNFSLSTLKCL